MNHNIISLVLAENILAYDRYYIIVPIRFRIRNVVGLPGGVNRILMACH